MRTEKQPAQDQRFSFIHRKLWEQETEKKGYKKFWHENDVAQQGSFMSLYPGKRRFDFENKLIYHSVAPNDNQPFKRRIKSHLPIVNIIRRFNVYG
jgi:hypothetical protein